MKKRTLKAGSYQRHYAKLPTCILMYRERKNLVEVPEGALVGIHKAGRKNHIVTVTHGKGKEKELWYLSVPAENLPKIKVEGAAPAKGKGKGTKTKGTKVATPNVAVEQPAGMGPQDIQPQVDAQPAPVVEQPAPAAVEAPAPAAEAAPAEQPAPAVEAAV